MARGLKFGCRKQRDCTIYVAKTKALISCAVTAQLICVFVFAFAKSRFSHNEAHIIIYIYRHDCRADKNPYRHDRRADIQCLHKNLKLLFSQLEVKRRYFSQLNRYGNCSQKSEKITEYSAFAGSGSLLLMRGSQIFAKRK